MKVTYYGNVEAKRNAELPSMHRQLEMIWKAIEQLNRGVELSDDVVETMDRVMILSKKFPLPPPGQL